MSKLFFVSVPVTDCFVTNVFTVDCREDIALCIDVIIPRVFWTNNCVTFLLDGTDAPLPVVKLLVVTLSVKGNWLSSCRIWSDRLWVCLRIITALYILWWYILISITVSNWLSMMTWVCFVQVNHLSIYLFQNCLWHRSS